MKKTLHRLFCLLLCAVMVVGMIPASAAAAETEEPAAAEAEAYIIDVLKDGTTVCIPTTFQKEEPVVKTTEEPQLSFSARNAVTKDGSNLYFETFEDLQTLAADTYSERTSAYYTGSGDLVISEDLCLPENLDVNVYEHPLIVEADVTLTHYDSLYVNYLTIKGTLVQHGSLRIYESLTVTGSIHCNANFCIDYDAVMSGMDNITYTDQGHLSYHWDVSTMAGLKEAVAGAKADPDHDYEIFLSFSSDFTITESLTFPENATFACWVARYTLTIASGATVTFNNWAWITSPMVINGKLVNNDTLWYYGSSMAFASADCYSGSGELCLSVENTSAVSYTDIITGLDFTDWVITGNVDSWVLQDLSGLPQLSAPTELSWNKAERYYYDEDTDSYYSKTETRYGSVHFRPGAVADTGDEYFWFRITVYRDDEFVYTTQLGYTGAYLNTYDYAGIDLTTDIEYETGEYYYTVQATSENGNYRDSEIVTSPKWTYTKPTSRYARPTNLRWEDGPKATWDRPIKDYYNSMVEIYYAPTKTAELQYCGRAWGEKMTDFEISKWYLEWFGPGYYYFKARTVSSNITTKYHSAWTELSDAYHYTGENKPVAPTLKSAIDASTGKPVLNWERSPLANKYRIYRATSKSGTYKSIGVVDSGDIQYDTYTYTDTTAKAGTKYYYKVRAYSYTDVTSSLSNAVSRLCDLARPSVSITGNSSTGKPIVKWETVEGADRYYIYRATSKTGTYTRIKTAISARSYEDTTAKAGTNYYYKVKAIYDDNTSANSAYSKIVNRMCDLKRPVVNISLTSGGNPYLKWTEISGAEKYYVYRATSKSGTYKYLGASTSGKYIDKEVTEGKTYYYKVKAIHAKSSANSAYSAIDSIKAK